MKFTPLVVLLLLCSLAYAQPHVAFESNGRWGVRDSSGATIISAQFDEVGWQGQPLSVVNGATGYRMGTQWGLVAVGGRRITPPDFEVVLPGEGAFFIAYKKLATSVRPLAGVITGGGREVIPYLYDVLRFSGLRIVAGLLQAGQLRYGLLDTEGNVLIPLRYATIRSLGSLRYAGETFENKIRLFTEDGQALNAEPFDSLSEFRYDKAVFYIGLKQGLVDRQGKVLAKPLYTDIKVDHGFSAGYRSPQWNVLTSNNRILDTLEGDQLQMNWDYLSIRLAGSWMLLNGKREPVTPDLFNEVGMLAEGTVVVRYNGLLGALRDDGHWLLPPRFEFLTRHGSFNRTMEKREGRPQWSLWGTLGLKLTQAVYDEMKEPQFRHYPVRKNGYWGLVDEYGLETVYCVFDSLYAFSDNLVAVGFRGKYGIIDYQGNWKLPPQQQPVALLDEAHYLEVSGPTKFIRRVDGYVVYFTDNPVSFQSDHFSERLSSGAIRKLTYEGRPAPAPLVPEGTQEIYELVEGLRGIKKDGRYGFVDSRGRLRIANRYEAIGVFNDGLAPVMIRGKWGFIDASDRIVIQPRYDSVTSFSPLSIVKRNGYFGLLDRSGSHPLETLYDSLYYHEGHFILRKGHKLGLSTLDGRITLEPKYDYLEPAGGGSVIVGQQGKYGLVNREGVSTIPMIYEELIYQPSKDLYFGKWAGYWETIR